jgi:hypothetical protein
MVLGVGMGVGVTAAEVVKMNERKKTRKEGGLTVALVILPIIMFVVVVGGNVGIGVVVVVWLRCHGGGCYRCGVDAVGGA